MLLNRHGAALRVSEVLFWACTWGIGAAIGVAVGGWVTLVGGAGAPGAAALEPVTDLVVLPAVAFAGVMIVHVLGQVVVAAARGRRAVQRRQAEGEDERA